MIDRFNQTVLRKTAIKLQRDLDSEKLHVYAMSVQQQLSRANTERTTIDRVSA